MIRIDETKRTLFDDYIVKVDSLSQAKKVVKKMQYMGYDFLPNSVEKYECYYIAIRSVLDDKQEIKHIKWGRSEVEKSNEFDRMMSYEEFIKNDLNKINSCINGLNKLKYKFTIMETNNNFILKEDMICPVSKKHCYDECCTVGTTCNMSCEGEDDRSCEGIQGDDVNENRETFICECGSLEHQITVYYDDEEKSLYFCPHLITYDNFFKRLWVGLKYAFGYKSRYGAWDEVIMDPNNQEKLKRFLNRN